MLATARATCGRRGVDLAVDERPQLLAEQLPGPGRVAGPGQRRAAAAAARRRARPAGGHGRAVNRSASVVPQSSRRSHRPIALEHAVAVPAHRSRLGPAGPPDQVAGCAASGGSRAARTACADQHRAGADRRDQQRTAEPGRPHGSRCTATADAAKVCRTAMTSQRPARHRRGPVGVGLVVAEQVVQVGVRAPPGGTLAQADRADDPRRPASVATAGARAQLVAQLPQGRPAWSRVAGVDRRAWRTGPPGRPRRSAASTGPLTWWPAEQPGRPGRSSVSPGDRGVPAAAAAASSRTQQAMTARRGSASRVVQLGQAGVHRRPHRPARSPRPVGTGCRLPASELPLRRSASRSQQPDERHDQREHDDRAQTAPAPQPGPAGPRSRRLAARRRCRRIARQRQPARPSGSARRRRAAAEAAAGRRSAGWRTRRRAWPGPSRATTAASGTQRASRDTATRSRQRRPVPAAARAAPQHVVQHRRGEPAGKGVLLADVVTTQQRRRRPGSVHPYAVAEGRPRTRAAGTP